MVSEKFRSNLKRLVPGRTTEGDLVWISVLLVILIISTGILVCWFATAAMGFR